MVELLDAWLPITAALRDATVAWQTPDQLATALNLGVDETSDLLSVMDLAGWIEIWECEGGPFITFSPLAAERLELQLVESGLNEVPRWARTSEIPRARGRSRRKTWEVPSTALNDADDDSLSPDQAAEVAEQAATRHGALDGARPGMGRVEDLPMPTLLIGQRLTPWPGPKRNTRGACPACGNRELEPHIYCLYCDRWGLDLVVLSLAKECGQAPPKPATTRSPQFTTSTKSKQEQLQHETERSRRKEKHLKRQRTKIEAERIRKQATRPKSWSVRPPKSAHEEAASPESSQALR